MTTTKAQTKTDKVIAALRAHPDATWREVAEKVGCCYGLVREVANATVNGKYDPDLRRAQREAGRKDVKTVKKAAAKKAAPTKAPRARKAAK